MSFAAGKQNDKNDKNDKSHEKNVKKPVKKFFRQLAPCTFHSYNILCTPVQNRRSVELVNHLPSPHAHPYAALRLVFGPWQHWQHLWLPPEQGS